MKEQDKIEIKKSQKGQQIAKELIQAVRNIKKEIPNEEEYSSLRDCLENNDYAKQFIADLSDKENYKPINKEKRDDNIQNLIADISYRENKRGLRRKIIRYSFSCASALIALSLF